MSDPVLIAMLFADRFIEEKNGKKGLIGIFTSFHADKFPILFPPWFIYVAITNIEGEHQFSANLANDLKEVVFSINGEFVAQNRDRVNDFIFPIHKAIFPRSGLYTFTFNIEGKQIGARILEVVSKTQKEG